MRKIITTTFVTLDGVMQGEHATEQDTLEGFTQGDWAAKFDNDKVVEQVMDSFMKMPFELLLGRKTYDIWSGYWPYTGTGDAPNVATPFNATKKYVVSHASAELAWANSVMVTGEVVSEIKKLKEMDALDLWVWGSSNLIQTLLKHDLIDEMYIWTYPVTVGEGKRLFSGGR
jgi:dihydrofolate reductase